MDNSLLIYSIKITNRNKYIFNLIFKDILGLEYVLTDDIDKLKKYSGSKISYTHTPIADELFFQSTDLLFETGIQEQNISVFEYQNSKVFFKTSEVSTFPFDVFAASFYLASRYEEYLSHERDEHDRFDERSCLAVKHQFEKKPLINIWAEWIKKCLKEKYPTIQFQHKKYEFISTIDIDNAYAYKEKGFFRNAGGFVRAVLKFDFKEISERRNVLSGKINDPYDTFEYQKSLIEKYKFKNIYFFLLGDYGAFDKNVPAANKNFQQLILTLSSFSEIGIHPSYRSNNNQQQLKQEIGRLSDIINKSVIKSRQHFLKLSFPHTYRNLIEAGITDDYTMGYAKHIGFRASVCSPFYFYDLKNEIETTLRIHPFAMMEGAMKYHMDIRPENAINYIQLLIDEVKAVDGIFMSLWHNDTLNDKGIWKGWRNVFEKMVEIASEK